MVKLQNRKSHLETNKTRKAPPAGWNSKLIVGDVKSLKCGLCADIYNDPHQYQIGNINCEGCCEAFFIHYTGGHNCPTCQVEMNGEDLGANLFVKTIIEDMFVACTSLEDYLARVESLFGLLYCHNHQKQSVRILQCLGEDYILPFAIEDI